MAFSSTERAVIQLAGFTPPLIICVGDYASSAGGTGGVIAGGYNNTNGTLAASGVNGSAGLGARQLATILLTPTASDATAPGAAISYDTTLDAQKATIVTTADTAGRYMIIAVDNGA